MLFTLIPAAFVAHGPLSLLREFTWAKTAVMLAATLIIILTARWSSPWGSGNTNLATSWSQDCNLKPLQKLAGALDYSGDGIFLALDIAPYPYYNLYYRR